MSVLIGKTYAAPPVCDREILRYAGVKGEGDGQTLALLAQTKKEALDKLVYKVCYRVLPVCVRQDVCNFSLFTVRSQRLAQRLNGCQTAVVFAATLGVELDRLIYKYGQIAPSKALFLQAIGTERIESLCDVFCAEWTGATARFSPGYGDMPLQTQTDIFAVLDCQRKIGLTLNHSLMMSPSKSVTAIFGLGGDGKQTERCTTCNQAHCAYKREEI